MTGHIDGDEASETRVRKSRRLNAANADDMRMRRSKNTGIYNHHHIVNFCMQAVHLDQQTNESETNQRRCVVGNADNCDYNIAIF